MLFKNPLITIPKHYNLKIKREIFTTPSYVREKLLNYISTFYINFLILNNENIIKQIKFSLNNFPLMILSSRCFNRKNLYCSFYKYKEEFKELGGYFIIKGKERTLRITMTLKRNHYFIIKKPVDRIFSRNILFIKKIKKNNEPITIEVSYSAWYEIFVSLNFNKELNKMLLEIILYSFDKFFLVKLFKWNNGVKISSDKNENFYINRKKNQSIFIMINNLFILKIFNKLQYLNNRIQAINYISTILGRVSLKKYFSTKNDLIFYNFKEFFLNEEYLKVNNALYLLCFYEILFKNDYNKHLIDNLNLFTNLELVLPGKLCLQPFKLMIYNSYMKTFYLHTNLINANSFDFRSLDSINSPVIVSINKSLLSKLNTLIKLGNLTMIIKKEHENFGYSVHLERLNKISFISNFDLVHRGIYYRKQIKKEPRYNYLENFGFLCPIHTPDGTISSLINHFSLGSIISIEKRPNKIPNYDYYIELNSSFNSIDTNIKTSFFLNNKYYSLYYNTVELHQINISSKFKLIQLNYKIKKLKTNTLSYFINNYNPSFPLKTIYTDEIIIFEKTVSNDLFINISTHVDESNKKEILKQSRSCNFQLIGVFEQLNLKISFSKKFYNSSVIYNYTHENLTYDDLLSFTASLLLYCNHNQSTRNIYQCKMSKHAVGIPSKNFLVRNDSKLLYLSYVQVPICSTINTFNYGLNFFSSGCNLIVSICSLTGLDMEDACVFNKKAASLGLFQKFILNETKKSLNSKFEFFLTINNIIIGNKHKTKKFMKENLNIIKKFNNYFDICYDYDLTLSNNSKIPKTYFNDFDFYSTYSNPIIFKSKKKSFQKRQICFKLYKRNTRIGDKLSSRHGQKHVISMLVESQNLPFNECDGVVPDLILNPHSFPSRMTLGMIREMIASRGSAIAGQTNIKYLFGIDDLGCDWLKDCSKNTLIDENSIKGDNATVDGKKGELIKTNIFTGIIFYQKMLQMVQDKIQYRITGHTNLLTGQPVKGRKKGGGIRLGEMEKDAIVAHGTSWVLVERFLKFSDLTMVTYCIACDTIVSYTTGILNISRKKINHLKKIDKTNNIVECKTKCCPNHFHVVIAIPSVFKFLLGELQSYSFEALFYILIPEITQNLNKH